MWFHPMYTTWPAKPGSLLGAEVTQPSSLPIVLAVIWHVPRSFVVNSLGLEKDHVLPTHLPFIDDFLNREMRPLLHHSTGYQICIQPWSTVDCKRCQCLKRCRQLQRRWRPALSQERMPLLVLISFWWDSSPRSSLSRLGDCKSLNADENT